MVLQIFFSVGAVLPFIEHSHPNVREKIFGPRASKKGNGKLALPDPCAEDILMALLIK